MSVCCLGCMECVELVHDLYYSDVRGCSVWSGRVCVVCVVWSV